MKKITTLLLLLPFLVTAQGNIDYGWKNSINNTFQPQLNLYVKGMTQDGKLISEILTIDVPGSETDSN